MTFLCVVHMVLLLFTSVFLGALGIGALFDKRTLGVAGKILLVWIGAIGIFQLITFVVIMQLLWTQGVLV